MNLQLDATKALLSVMGVVAWVFAGMFGMSEIVKLGPSGADAPNIVAAGGVCGFAIAGGLCLLGAGLVSRSAPSGSPRTSESSDIPNTKL